MTTVPPNVDYGCGPTATANEILRTLVGSGVHGIAIEGTDDRDEMGVFIEPPRIVLGPGKPLDHHVWRTQPEGVRSGPGDIDLTIYSLRKYVRLALAGNPTILVPLFAAEEDVIIATPWGEELRALTPVIVSQQAGRRFLGYLDQQYERMLGGGKRNRVPKRPELVERYGYDTKYASHALRLSYQGVEIMETGRLTLPLPDEQREMCRRVKLGMLGLGHVRTLVETNREVLRGLVDSGRSPLPPAPDYPTVSDWMMGAHRSYWGWSGPKRPRPGVD